jgi:hypothetical protein
LIKKIVEASLQEKRHSFVGTDEYIRIIIIGFEIDEYNVIFISLGPAPMNLWVIRLTLTGPIYSSVTWHIFIDEYMGRRPAVMGPPIFVGLLMHIAGLGNHVSPFLSSLCHFNSF